MSAVSRLRSIGWVLLVGLAAICCYLVSLRVATERTALLDVRQQIVATQRQMRNLETEFAARSSLRQLEMWNSDSYRYSTPNAGQYLGGEQALASLDGIKPNGPGYIALPVMTAMVETSEDLPSAAIPQVVSPSAQQVRPAATVPDAPTKAAPAKAAPVKMAMADAPAKSPKKAAPQKAKDKSKSKSKSKASAPTAKAPKGPVNLLAELQKPTHRTERIALLEEKLLDDRTMSELNKRAVAERRQTAAR